ncbi:MAG: D-alanyl-D-alanine carboxypeptidase [Hydrogenibacillus schlegelii]|nr:D-alanyl-D-alanine carboxypeptidase [Hydrogenibacillus schlegelii]
MRTARRLALAVLIGLVLWVQMGVPAQARPDDLKLDVRSALLVDAKTGRVLYADANIDTPYPPASMTKMMTEYLVLEAIQAGKLRWDDVITASDTVYFLGKHAGSRVFLNAGEKRTVRELFEAMAIYSANDATVALAEAVAGTETAFVERMNEKAQALGLTHTHFVTATGYPEDELGPYRPNVPGEQTMSARDAALLGLALLRDHPEVLQFTSIPKKTFREGEANPLEMINWNWLLPGLPYAYEGTDGLKTGHTEAAKFSITATAKRGDMRLVAVVIGAESEKGRFEAARKLFDYGFSHFRYETVARKGDRLPEAPTIEVQKGKSSSVPVVLGEDAVDVVADGGDGPKLSVELGPPPEAPVKAGDRVGIVRLEQPDLPYLAAAYAEAAAVSLVAEADVPRAGAFQLFFRAIFDWIGRLFNRITGGLGASGAEPSLAASLPHLLQ